MKRIAIAQTMKIIAVLLLCAAAAWTMPLEESEPQEPWAVLPLDIQESEQTVPMKNIDSRIIAGHPASKGQFPWQVAIYLNEGNSFCGGSLISTEWVLTAAHCAKGIRSFNVHLGVISLSDSSRVTRTVSQAIVHPQYNDITIQHDIALLKLSSPVTSNNNIAPIHLATSTLGDGASVTVSGWGKTSDSSSGVSQTLNYVSLHTISNDDCKKTYGNNITTGIVCTKGARTESTCNGDSGGPLITGSSSSAVQVGIVSFGHRLGCAKQYPAAFTRVARYRDWIKLHSDV